MHCTERHHIGPAVVVTKDRAEIRSLLRHAMGTPLAHADPMAVALTTHQQLPALSRELADGRWQQGRRGGAQHGTGLGRRALRHRGGDLINA